MTLDQRSGAVGLDAAAVRARVQAGQVNTAPPSPGRTVSQILRANVLTRFNAILGAMFVVVVMVGPVQDALFGVVLVVNTGLPPVSVGEQVAGAVLASIGGLTFWRRFGWRPLQRRSGG